MVVKRSSRELSGRVEIKFHQHPNRLRRLTWQLALAAGVLTAAWLIYEASAGDHRIYEAGPLTTPHKMFEADCSKCHNTWQPVVRLVKLDFANEISSVESYKCMACHKGPTHHINQVPAAESLQCAECHREHRGEEQLAWVDDRLCVKCHMDLMTSTGPSESFALNVEHMGGASAKGAHPEFAFRRLLDLKTDANPIGPNHKVHDLIGWMQRSSDPEPKWQDKARIRFSHAAHLRTQTDSAGRTIYGLVGKNPRDVDFEKSCHSCHEPDDERRYMLPISYEKHCAECHPLYFDVDEQQQTAPHRSPEVVRGFLTDFYTLQAAKGKKTFPPQKNMPERPLPGRTYRSPINHEEAETIIEQVARAEQAAISHTDLLLNRRGGCQYCHEVKPPDPEANENGLYEIVPPRIPERWLPHSRFRHDSHRMLSCVSCHGKAAGEDRPIEKSHSTGDVLLPSLGVCLNCHTTDLRNHSEIDVETDFEGARTDCVECHVYHSRADHNFDGRHSLESFLSKETAGAVPGRK